ncbi:hypothetical protein [Streptomyces sp. NPDC057428]|uniref:hypothetical protein n=1 Tax=Streptomyces sp. NPDC057428 TaxID=3346129 RepID=UPI0036CCEA49
MVIDGHDDALHTHTALAAHHPPSGRITLHPGPGTTSNTGLAHDLLAALGKPPLLPGRFPGGRQPAWEAATAWMIALPVTRLTVLRAHRLTVRRAMRLLQLQALTGVHLTLVCHRPHLPAAPHQALQTADYSVTTDFETARRHYYGTPITEPAPTEEPAGPAGRWLTLPALDRLVSYDSPRPCADLCTPPPIIWRHRPPPVPLTAPTTQRVAHRLHAATAHPRLAAAIAAALFTGASLQQLATARPRDYDDAAATLALHDRTRYTDGCAAHPVPPWTGIFLRAAACFTRLVPGEEQELLAAPGDRGHLLRVAETARLRPPQPLAAHRESPGECHELGGNFT